MKFTDKNQHYVKTFVTKSANEVVDILRIVLSHLPSFIEDWIASFVKLLRHLRVPLWIIYGNENSTNLEISVMFTGSEANKNYLKKLIFNGTCEQEYVGKVWLWDIFKLKNDTGSHALLFAEVPNLVAKLVQRNKAFYIPCWVNGKIDLSQIDKIIKKNSLSSTINRIKRNKLEFEVTNEQFQFEMFYNDMYLPYITKRHGESAIVTEYALLLKRFQIGSLLLIKKETKYIAGCIINYTKNAGNMLYLGIHFDNMERYLHEGAIGAIYYYSLKLFEEKGFHVADNGDSRPFLKDGILIYKKRWGTRFQNRTHVGLMFLPLTDNFAVKEFLTNNPFIFKDGNGISGAVFLSGHDRLDEKYFKSIYSDYYFKGFSHLYLYIFGQNFDANQCIIPEDLSDKITIRSGRDIFKNHK